MSQLAWRDLCSGVGQGRERLEARRAEDRLALAKWQTLPFGMNRQKLIGLAHESVRVSN